MTSGSETNSSLPTKTLATDYDGHNLVFVVGCPRSGTTWLQRLLSTHPKIHTGQESHVFTVNVGEQLKVFRMMTPARHKRGTGLSCYLTEEEFLRILKPFLLKLLEPMVANLSPDELFLEKTPDHALFLSEIFELLPGCRIIHMLRDTRDVVSSMLSGDDWLSSWAPRSASAAANMWEMRVQAIRRAMPELPPGRLHEVRYEDLSHSPIEVLRGCADFLGLEWDPAEITRAVEENRASRARANGGGSPIPLSGEAAKQAGTVVVEPKNFIRKAKVGSWKSDLSLYQKFRVWRVAHQLMDEVGYSWPTDMELIFRFLSASIDVVKLALSPKKRKRRRQDASTDHSLGQRQELS